MSWRITYTSARRIHSDYFGRHSERTFKLRSFLECMLIARRTVVFARVERLV